MSVRHRVYMETRDEALPKTIAQAKITVLRYRSTYTAGAPLE